MNRAIDSILGVLLGVFITILSLNIGFRSMKNQCMYDHKVEQCIIRAVPEQTNEEQSND